MVNVRKRVGKRVYAPPSRYRDGGASRKKKRKVGNDVERREGKLHGKRARRAQAAQARSAVTPESRKKAAATLMRTLFWPHQVIPAPRARAGA